MIDPMMFYIIVGSQAALNGLLIILWAYAQYVATKARSETSKAEELAKVEVKRLEEIVRIQDREIRANTVMTSTASKQMNRLIDLFLKPDPKLFEYLRREMNKAIEEAEEKSSS